MKENKIFTRKLFNRINYFIHIFKEKYYKYRYTHLTNHEHVAVFRCYDNRCSGQVSYNIRNKTFMLINPHYVKGKEECHFVLTEQDKRNIIHMVENKIESFLIFK